MVQKYPNIESIVDEFVSILLRELMFNEEWLFVFPQLPLKLIFGTAIKEAIADKTIMDIVSFYRMAVFEDKSVENVRVNCEPQMIAEAIAVHQQNMRIKKTAADRQASKRVKKTHQDSKDEEASPDTYDDGNEMMQGVDAIDNQLDEPLVAVRVNSHEFYFYSVSITSHILQAMQLQQEAVSETEVKKFCNLLNDSIGFNFLHQNDRQIIIESLDKICYVLRQVGILSERRESVSACILISISPFIPPTSTSPLRT